MKPEIVKIGAIAVLALICLLTRPSAVFSGAKPTDRATGCPKDGKYSQVSAILLDTTDSLSPVQQEEIQKKLDEFVDKVPHYGKLELFAVRPSSERLIEPLLEVCNPGRGSDTNEWTGNPRLLEKRWHDKFRQPFDKSLKAALSESVSAKQSPIMEEIQQVSVNAFFETPPGTDKQFTIVSDMLQNSAVLDQYRNPESFEQFKLKPGFIRVRPQLGDVNVTILYVRRTSDFKLQGKHHVEFWQSFLQASGARIDEIMSIGG